MDTRFTRWGRVALIPLAVAGALFVACSDDEEPEATATEEAMAEAVVVTAVDYGFEGLPESVKAGTKISLVNSSAAELHEFVAVLLPAGEERPAAELMALPEEELFALMGDGEPASVILAAPGTGADANIVAVGDGTLTVAGRYLILCAIPVGADPAAYAAAAATSDGPPEVEGGPPHFVQGMFGELTVE